LNGLLEHDEKLAFAFAVSTLAPEIMNNSPSAERFTFLLESCLNPRTRQVWATNESYDLAR
jgi:hypothetical protein